MIDLTHVERTFIVGDQAVHALDDITLHVEPGEYLSIMGPSGSGKSTLLNILGLLDRPSGGEYRLQGRDVGTLDDAQQARVRRDTIGFVFQFFHLVPRLSAAENVALPLMLAGVAPAERERRVREALESVALTDRANHRPEQLSGGQRQRAAIARATVMRPAAILADEPTGNLDRQSGIDIVEILERLNAGGMTLLLVTHDPELGARAARRVGMIDGRIDRDTGRETSS